MNQRFSENELEASVMVRKAITQDREFLIFQSLLLKIMSGLNVKELQIGQLFYIPDDNCMEKALLENRSGPRPDTGEMQDRR